MTFKGRRSFFLFCRATTPVAYTDTLLENPDSILQTHGLGLAHSLYWPVFFKRSDIKFWLIFLEKFGMPTAVGRLPGGRIDDVSEQQRALQALQAIQTDSAVVAPKT